MQALKRLLVPHVALVNRTGKSVCASSSLFAQVSKTSITTHPTTIFNQDRKYHKNLIMQEKKRTSSSDLFSEVLEEVGKTEEIEPRKQDAATSSTPAAPSKVRKNVAVNQVAPELEAMAIKRRISTSSKKLLTVCKLIRKQKASEAMKRLQLCARPVASVVAATLKQACNNAWRLGLTDWKFDEHLSTRTRVPLGAKFSPHSEPIVYRVEVGRFQAIGKPDFRARGRMGMRHKPTVHLKISVTTLHNILEAKKRRAANKAARLERQTEAATQM
jgi:ribosomal protein L22